MVIMDYSNLPTWVIPVFVWTMIWKAIASWKAARKGHLSWFIVFFAINTFGILPILYTVVLKNVKFFSVDLDLKKVAKKTEKNKSAFKVKKKVKKMPTLNPEA